MQVRIVGVKKSEYKGKDGKDKTGYNYCGMKEYTQYEKENAYCEGLDVVREFSSMDFGIHPGDTVEFLYEPGYQDKATLVDVRILAIADNPPFKEGSGAGPQNAAETKKEDQKTKQ